MPPPVNLEDEEDDDYLKRQQSEIDKLKNRNRNLEDDLRRLGDQAPRQPMRDSVGLSAQSMKTQGPEMRRLQERIQELENELAR